MRDNKPAENNIDPGFLRWRAQHYRGLAEKTADPHLVSIYRELAKAFDKGAEAEEKPESASRGSSPLGRYFSGVSSAAAPGVFGLSNQNPSGL
jgi:hypothetical protein